MTKNLWDTDQLNANGETLIGNGSGVPSVSTITSGTNCTVVNGANSIQLTYTGSSGSSDFELISSATASSSSSIVFTNLSSSYFTYIIIITGFIPSTDGDILYMRTSTDNGSSYDSGSSDYWIYGYSWASYGIAAKIKTDPGSFMNACGNVNSPPGNGTNESSCAFINIHNPSSTNYTRFNQLGCVFDNISGLAGEMQQPGRFSAADVDAIQFTCPSSTIASGEFRLYGLISS